MRVDSFEDRASTGPVPPPQAVAWRWWVALRGYGVSAVRVAGAGRRHVVETSPRWFTVLIAAWLAVAAVSWVALMAMVFVL